MFADHSKIEKYVAYILELITLHIQNEHSDNSPVCTMSIAGQVLIFVLRQPKM